MAVLTQGLDCILEGVVTLVECGNESRFGPEQPMNFAKQERSIRKLQKPSTRENYRDRRNAYPEATVLIKWFFDLYL